MLTDEELSALTGTEDDWKLSPVDGGFQGSHYTLESGLMRWFVKVQPPGRAQEFYDRSGSFVKEPAVYKDLLPPLRCHIQRKEKLWPDLYLGRKGALVLEDLVSTGWTLSPQRLDHHQILVVLDSLADLHTGSMLLERESGTRLPLAYPGLLEESYLTGDPTLPGMQTWLSFLRTSAKICGIYFPGRMWGRAIDIMRRAPEYVKPSETFRNCLCHGDPWQNNIFFKYQEGHPLTACLVDWVQVRYCPPSLEVLLFLRLLQVDDSLRRPYIEHYLKRVGSVLPDFSIPDFERSTVAVGEPFSLSLAALYVYLTRLPKAHLEEITVSQEDFWAFATGQDGPAMDALANDLEYRSALLRAFRELIDYAEASESPNK